MTPSRSEAVRGQRRTSHASLSWFVLIATMWLWSSARAEPAPTVLALRESFEPAPEFGGVVHVIEAGLTDAPPVVLIHGIGKRAAHDFDAILPWLSTRHHVLAFDLPGFGRSSRTPDAYSPERYVRFLDQLIARHFRGPVAIVGHSMGAALAIQLAADHPERVSRLALLDVAGILHYRAYLLELNAGNPSQPPGRFKAVWRGARAAVLRMFSSLESLENLRLDTNAGWRRYLPVKTTTTVAFIEHDFGPALRKVHVPTWLGWGRRDRIAPERTAQLLRFMLRPVRDDSFEASGHAPMRTEPELVARSLLGFLAQPLPAARAQASLDIRSNRVGSCSGEEGAVFEGDYMRIEIRDCKRVLLRKVRTRSLAVERSSAELQHVEILGTSVGATFKNARVRWTGGRIVAPTCIDSQSDELDFAGVSCNARDDALRVHGRGWLHASASSLASGSSERALHGEYELSPTGDGSTDSTDQVTKCRRRLPGPKRCWR